MQDNRQDEMVDIARQAVPAGPPLPHPSEPRKPKARNSTSGPKLTLTTWNQNAEARFRAKFTKEVSEWNRKDFIRYIAYVYYEATGSNFEYAYQRNYQDLNEFEHKLEHKAKIVDCPPQLLRDYIDFAFQRFVVPMIARGTKFSSKLFVNETAVSEFVEKYRTEKPQNPPADEVQPSTLTLVALEDAYAINSRFFELTYGPILHVNFLIAVKGLPVEPATICANGGIDRAEAQSQEAQSMINLAVKKYGPYPKWLPFLDVERFKRKWLSKIEVCDDSKVFDFLKSCSGEQNPSDFCC